MERRRPRVEGGWFPAAGTWRRRLGSVVLFASLLPAVLGAANAIAADAGFFRIGTAGTAGTYFQLGGVIAAAISSPPGLPNCQQGGVCGVPGLIAVAQATQGSVENVELIGKGQLESALVQADVASWAYNGTGIFRAHGRIANLRAIGALYPETVHVVVRADSPIKTLRDLRGKHVSLGEKASGTLADARIVLEMAGLGERDVKPDYSRLADAANGLRDGTLDAFFLVGGYPVPAIADLADSTPIRLIPIDQEVIDKLKKRYPFFSGATIPAGSYHDVDGDTTTAAINALWVASADIPDERVYEIAKALWNPATHKLIVSRTTLGQRIVVEHALDGIDIPLHPGAERYYREKGLLSGPGLK